MLGRPHCVSLRFGASSAAEAAAGDRRAVSSRRDAYGCSAVAWSLAAATSAVRAGKLFMSLLCRPSFCICNGQEGNSVIAIENDYEKRPL